MSEPERATILQSAERAGTVLVLDETTADLDIDRGHVSPGFSDGDPSLVIRIGSLGKTVWGGLRVGWIRGEALQDFVNREVQGRPIERLAKPFAVVATAGLGQIGGAAIAALLIGVARSFAIYLAPELEVLVPYLIMVLVLLVRPQGMFSVPEARRI